MRKVFIGAAVAALTVLPLPAPAHAAPPTVKPFLTRTTIAPGGETQYADLVGRLSTPDRLPHRIEYTIDVGDIDDFAEFAPVNIFLLADEDDDPCTTSGTEITCVLTDIQSYYRPYVGLGFFSVETRPGAAPGDTGRVTITASADGGPATTTSAEVRVGEPVNLTAEPEGDRLTAAPGGTVEVSPEVGNSGTIPVRGAVLLIAPGGDLHQGSNSNCVYSAFIFCTFDQTLQPGNRYRPRTGIRLRAPKAAAGGSSIPLTTQWLTASDWAELTKYLPEDGRRGTGAALRLVQVPGAAAVPQTDIQPGDEYSQIGLTVSGVRPDVAAIGATVPGAVGDEVKVQVGLENRGPGALLPELFANNYFQVRVTMPANLRVVGAPDSCIRLDEDFGGSPSKAADDGKDNAGGRLYSCYPEFRKLAPGDRSLLAFTAEVTKGVSGGGLVQLESGDEQRLEYGKDIANNSANLVVTVAGAGGGLPITGYGGMLAVGQALVIGGVVLVVLSRRRRSHRG